MENMKPMGLKTALCVAALTFATSVDAKDNRFVEVGGARYRVQIVSDTEVLVFKKAAVVRWSLGERDQMLEAARQATGCDVGEYLIALPRFSVRIDCHGKGVQPKK